MAIQHYLDLKNVSCPLPVLKTQAYIKTLSSGEILIIECTDPQTQRDIPSFCKARGYFLQKKVEKSGVFEFSIQVP
jgi:tRNA 2-thiouridine synthesizing protein A